jgi:hypothetical protein
MTWAVDITERTEVLRGNQDCQNMVGLAPFASVCSRPAAPLSCVGMVW